MGKFIKFLIAVTLVGLGAFCIGFGLYRDSYSGVKYTEEDVGVKIEVETKFCKEKGCTSINGKEIGCTHYCAKNLGDESDVCDSVKFRRATKAMNSLAFIFTIIGFVGILLLKLLPLPGFLLKASAGAAIFGAVCGFIAVLVYGVKNSKFVKDLGYDELPGFKEVYYYSYIMVVIGTAFSLIGGIVALF